MTRRIVALGFILVCASVAWFMLSLSMDARTRDKSSTTTDAIGGLWGTAHTQLAPRVTLNWEAEKKVEMTEKEKLDYLKRKLEEANLREKMGQPKPAPAPAASEEFFQTVKEQVLEPIELSGSDIKVSLDLDYRQKGLLWFSTYTVDFAADYQVENPKDHAVTAKMVFPFPSAKAVYDNMSIVAPGRADLEYHVEADGQNKGNRMVASFPLLPKAKQTVQFSNAGWATRSC